MIVVDLVGALRSRWAVLSCVVAAVLRRRAVWVSVLFCSGQFLSTLITRAQDSDTRSPSIEYVSHTKERPESNLNYTKRSLEGCNTPLDGSGTHTAGSTESRGDENRNT